MSLEKEDEKDLTRQEEDNSKESQKELKVPVKELEILKGREEASGQWHLYVLSLVIAILHTMMICVSTSKQA